MIPGKRTVLTLMTATALILSAVPSRAFEGYIRAVNVRGGPSIPLLYTVGTNFLLIEPTATNTTSPINLVDVNAGAVTVIYPQNRTYIRFKTSSDDSSGLPPGVPSSAEAAPPPPPPPPPPPQRPTGPGAGMAPDARSPGGPPPGIGPTNFPALPGGAQMPARPQMPQRPPMPQVSGGGGMGAMPPMPAIPTAAMLELRATGQTTNLLGYTCQGYEIKRHGETMEIWATDQLWPFQGYLFIQPHRMGPPMIEERWAEMVAAKKLFPLLAELKMDNGAERYRFEVQSIKPARLTEKDTEKFQVPAEYVQIMARPF